MSVRLYLKQFVVWATEWWQNNKRVSSVWRLTRLYTGLLLIVVSILLVILYQLSIGQISRQHNEQIQDLLQQQQRLANELPFSQFLTQFQLQSESSRQYILSYQKQGKTVGRLTSLPKNITRCPTQTRFPIWLDKYNELRLVSGCQQPISDGILMIAMDDESLYELKSQYITASIFALFSALLLGLITGLIFSTQLLKRINSFNLIAQQVESGKMSARVALSPYNDEYDHMAKHINNMLNQLQQTFETVSGITDAIAHDLRTPLSHLRLQIEAELLQKQQQHLPTKTIENMLIKLDEILYTFSAMLELTRLEQQPALREQQFKAVNLSQIILDASDLIEPLAEDNQQTILLLKNDPVVINGDATLLFRAIYNLLENSCKYSGKGAEITINSTTSTLEISDNGQGISDAEKEKVFQRLYRVEQSRNTPGFGLGLTLVKAIIQLHNGQITLQDNHPGLKVMIQLPLQ